ncbi:MAG: hypothetical protein ABRQ39_13865 [Candidatus Eremiobacterota bacterium]
MKIKIILIILIMLHICLNFPCESKENFQNLRGWNVVKMDMTADEVKKSLKGASVSFEENMFSKTGDIYFTLDKNGWEGTIYFNEKNRVNQILFQSPFIKNEGDVKKIVDTFTDKYGNPYEIKEIPLSDEGRKDICYIWKNNFITMELTTAYYSNEKEWVLWETYRPAR